MVSRLPDLEGELEARLGALGFELVQVEWAGTPRRPILRIRMDLPDSQPGTGGVTVDQCAWVSRQLERWLDRLPGIPDGYVLEVSSPGVERPLVRARDWVRFRGQVAKVRWRTEEGPVSVEGEILGVEEGGEGGGEAGVLLLSGGEEIRIPFHRIQRAHLLFRWK